jgi:hypothetical protein
MPSLAHQAEVQKLALLLNADPAALTYLDKLDTAAIRALRERTTAAMYDADAHIFGRIALATRLVPAAISAVIAEKALGPLLCARVAGQLPAKQAVDIAKRLHDRFLADVCIEIDPRQVRELIELMPVKRIVDVALELARRRAHIVMGRFVDSLPQPAMRAVLDALRDDEALLRIGLFVEDAAQLDAVIDLLPQQRLRGLIRLAVDHGGELWAEALALVNAIGATHRRRMAGMAAQLDDAALERMLMLSHAQGLWAELLPLIAGMDDRDRLRLLRLPGLHDDAVLAALMQAAEARKLWPQLMPLILQMDEALQARAIRVATQQPGTGIAKLARTLRDAAATAGRGRTTADIVIG